MYLTKGDIPVLAFSVKYYKLKKNQKTFKGTKLKKKIDNDKE